MRLAFTLRPRPLALMLAMLAIYLALQSLLSEYLVEQVIGDESDHVLVYVLDLFSVNLEDSLPTWYSTFLLLLAAILLALITRSTYVRGEPLRRYWLGLAVIFLYLSLDEGAAIHEILTDPLRETFNAGGYLYFAWQIGFIPIVIVIGLLYLRFLWQLPPHIRNLFILGGGVYLAGVLGFESISANQWYQAGEATFRYLAIATVEETCEMLGVIIFIYALLRHITERQDSYVVAAPESTDQPGAPLPVGRWLLLPLAVIVIINGLFIYLANRIEPAAPPPDAVASLPAYQGLLTEFKTAEMQTVHMSGIFTLNDPASHTLVRALVGEYEQVIVIAFPLIDASVILASDTATFDQTALADLLNTYGETNFVIYDPNLVRAVIATFPPAE